MLDIFVYTAMRTNTYRRLLQPDSSSFW